MSPGSNSKWTVGSPLGDRIMSLIKLIPEEEFERVRNAKMLPDDRLSLIADMCRANTLTAVKIAGSGHLGSSFSAMDIVVFLYYQEMNTVGIGLAHPDRDIYFSSKGHDVPGLYSVLHSLNIISREKLLRLRRLSGLDGHPDVGVPGIEVNSGSLGMGISKGKGMAVAKYLSKCKGRVFVLTGDGELQEGQIYESMQTASHQGSNNLIVIVDHNKVQTDKQVAEITNLGELEEKFKVFGWYVKRCDGHDFKQLMDIMVEFSAITDRPKILIADTIKGKGVSFMEHPRAIKDGKGLYRWHAGAPDEDAFQVGYKEIIDRINKLLAKEGLYPVRLEEIPPFEKAKSTVSSEYVAEAFGKALVKIAEEHRELVVLDADLAADCRVRYFEEAYPERFIENGIAEQDMVSMAGGLALQGFLPVVNTFAAFLASRANEQIYTNACEGTKIIYACHYAGLIPSGPGKSHQSIRDISLFCALPNFEIIQPCNAAETSMAVNYCVNESEKNCVLRLIIGPSPRLIELPNNYDFAPGRGVILKEGRGAIMFGYGPVMMHEALLASEILEESQLSLKVVNMPWLNRIDPVWLANMVKDCDKIFVVEDHAPRGGLGDRILETLVEAGLMKKREFKIFAVEGFPACGTPSEALRFHGLDGASLARRIKLITRQPSPTNRVYIQ